MTREEKLIRLLNFIIAELHNDGLPAKANLYQSELDKALADQELNLPESVGAKKDEAWGGDS